VALAVGVVAGCSGGGAKPGPSATTASSAPTASLSPTPTSSPTPDASIKPVRPAAMDQVSAAGAEAVAVYFLNLYPYVYASNDLTEWKALSHADCVFCASVTSHVGEQVAAGTRSEGGLVTISTVRSTVINPGRWWSVDVELTQATSSTVDGTGKVVEDFPVVKAYTMNLAVVYETDHWVVRGLSYTQTG
jgi:Family of unknown function (DUF6318)